MGGRVSKLDIASKERSDEIDRMLEEQQKHFVRNCKLLVLGVPGSGKTTIVKQLKIVHQDRFSDDELAEYRSVIYRNVLDSAKAIAGHVKNVGLQCFHLENKLLAEKITDYCVGLHNKPPHVSTEIAGAIYQLWNDPITAHIMDTHSNEFYLMDSEYYFFSEVLRIGAPGYLPNDTDVLHARQKLPGITETRFLMGQFSISMLDVSGQQGERKKWIHCFEGVSGIIFCTALSSYDQVLLEDESKNQMEESIALFESVINSRWFVRTPIILLLNKIDVFKNKVAKVPLEQYFSEYTGGSDFNKAAKYILWKFMQVNRARLSVYPHLTQATDTTNIRLVFAAIKETILSNALKDSSIL